MSWISGACLGPGDGWLEDPEQQRIEAIVAEDLPDEDAMWIDAMFAKFPPEDE